MPSFTAQNIIDRAAAAADMHDDFVPQSIWLAWLNVARQELCIKMARSGWVPFGMVSGSAVSPTTGTVPLNFEFLALIGVVEVDSSGRYRHLVAADFVDQVRQVDGTTAPITGPATRYFLTDDEGSTTLRLYPRPTTGTYTYFYLKAPTTIVTVSDTLTYPLGLEEYLVLRMARKALVKEESDTAAIDKELNAIQEQIELYGHERNWANAPKVRNTDDVERGWNLQLTYPPPNAWIWL